MRRITDADLKNRILAYVKEQPGVHYNDLVWAFIKDARNPDALRRQMERVSIEMEIVDKTVEFTSGTMRARA